MEKVKQVVQIFSSNSKQCPDCNFVQTPHMDIDHVINHYLTHGYKLLHVGQETTRDIDGKPREMTIAVLGIED